VIDLGLLKVSLSVILILVVYPMFVSISWEGKDGLFESHPYHLLLVSKVLVGFMPCISSYLPNVDPFISLSS
jgi:ACR3 family arsenite efflux pump ArsB